MDKLPLSGHDLHIYLTLSLPESIFETSNASLTFESVDEILWCDHSIEPSLAVLSLGTICFSMFFEVKFGMFLDFVFWTLLWMKGLSNVLEIQVRYLKKILVR